MKKTTVKNQVLSIRPAEKLDSKPLADLGARTFSDAYSDILPAKNLCDYLAESFNPDQMAKDISDPDILLFVVAHSDAICGYTKLQATPLPDFFQATHPMELVRLYVLNDWQGQGIGSALLSFGRESAKDKGYQTCWLKVWEGNLKAVKFYEKKGFNQVGDEPYTVGNICRNVILMACSLE